MSAEVHTKRSARHQILKGLGYVATGTVLIILALVFSCIALDVLST